MYEIIEAATFSFLCINHEYKKRLEQVKREKNNIYCWLNIANDPIKAVAEKPMHAKYLMTSFLSS
ncbi:hypothetical protein PMAG_a3986 [Pseudoalteromonas mariniglutinosa NCIMB 1770]|nr:hypothetical protein [Pseudoalteromonas mariniglutinosa NCIMB 1770]